MKNISVLIVDQALKDEAGKLSNAAFVIGLTCGQLLPAETFGSNVTDADGSTHRYLTNIGHYVRKAGQSKLRTLRMALIATPGVTVVDYAEAAAPADYSTYALALAAQSGEEISYRAIHVYGPEDIVVPLTKNLSRL